MILNSGTNSNADLNYQTRRTNVHLPDGAIGLRDPIPPAPSSLDQIVPTLSSNLDRLTELVTALRSRRRPLINARAPEASSSVQLIGSNPSTDLGDYRAPRRLGMSNGSDEPRNGLPADAIIRILKGWRLRTAPRGSQGNQDEASTAEESSRRATE